MAVLVNMECYSNNGKLIKDHTVAIMRNSVKFRMIGISLEVIGSIRYRFDALTTHIRNGFPAEIAARQKQY